MTGSPLTPDVPKGPATATGYGAAALGLVGMLLAYIFPEGDEQTLGVIAAGVIALGSLLWTNYGRQKQAVALIQSQGAVEAAKAEKAPAPAQAHMWPYDIRVEAGSIQPSDGDEDVLPPDTEGLDPEYTGRTGDLEDRRKLEGREGCA